jgi:hypothetical protein
MERGRNPRAPKRSILCGCALLRPAVLRQIFWNNPAAENVINARALIDSSCEALCMRCGVSVGVRQRVRDVADALKLLGRRIGPRVA